MFLENMEKARMAPDHSAEEEHEERDGEDAERDPGEDIAEPMGTEIDAARSDQKDNQCSADVKHYLPCLMLDEVLECPDEEDYEDSNHSRMAARKARI